MRARPVACLALLMFLLLTILPAGLFYEPLQLEEKCEGQLVGEAGRRTYRDDRMQLELYHCRIQTEKKSFETEHLLVYLTDTTEYPVGAVLSLSGTIYPVTEPTNPGQFDSRLYYGGKGISYTVYAEKAEVLSFHPKPVREGLLRLQGQIGQVYDAVFDAKDSGLLKAMVLGEKGELDGELKELYQKNGISHLLAISGLHISLVGLGFYRGMRRLTGSCMISGIPTVLLIAAYGWMTGASISAVRAAAMCSLVVLADLLGRTYDMLTAIGAAALIFMATNPLSVKQSAFLLSFGAVLAIGLLQPLWRLYGAFQGKLLQSLGVGLSVLVVTFPLLLRFFCEYPLYSTFLNLLVIPLMSVLMAAGLVCGFTGLLWLPAAKGPGFICHLILKLYEGLGERCMVLPGAVLHVGSPPAWKVALYYGALSLVLFILYREKRRKKYWREKEPFYPKKRLLAGSTAAMLLAAGLLCLRFYTGLSVTMLDVGQGDGIFFRDPDGTTYLCDGGSSNVSDVGTYRILPFLKSEGIRTLDYLLISHMDKDHIGGVQELLGESRKDGSIRIGHGVLPDLSVKDEAYMEMERLFSEAGVPILYMGTGDRLSGKDFSLTCLWPEKTAAFDDRNELSLVLLAEYGEFQMLLTGDIGPRAEAGIAASGLLRPVEVLKTAHHGSRYSTGAAFLGQVRPAVSLISCSAANRYGHPGEETLKRLLAVGSRVLITKDCGAIRVWTDGRKVRVRTYVN